MKKKSISLEDSIIDLYLKVKSAIYYNQKTTDLDSIKKLNTVIIVDYISTLCNILIENSKFNANYKISDSSNDLLTNLQSKKFSFNSLLNQINNNSQDEYSDIKVDDNSLNINKRKSTFKHEKLDVIGEGENQTLNKKNTGKHFIIDSVTCSMFTGNNTNEDSMNMKDKQTSNLNEKNDNENKILETISNFEATNDNNDNIDNNEVNDNDNNEVICNNEPNNENDISYQCSPEVYEKLLQEHESTIRNHIKLEHQLKLQNEAYVIRIEELERKLEKLNSLTQGLQINQKDIVGKEVNLVKKGSKVVVDKAEEDLAMKISNLKSTITSLNKDIVNYKNANSILHKRISELEKKIKLQATNYEKSIKILHTDHKNTVEQLKAQIKIYEEKNITTNNNFNVSDKQNFLNVFSNCSSSTISKLSEEKFNFNNKNTSENNNVVNNTLKHKSIDNISVGLFNSTININMPNLEKNKIIKLNKTHSDNFNNFNETNNSINDSHNIDLQYKLNNKNCLSNDNKEKEMNFANTTGLSSNKVNNSTINTSSMKESKSNSNNAYHNSEYISIANNNIRNKDTTCSLLNKINGTENYLASINNNNVSIEDAFSINENEINLSLAIKNNLKSCDILKTDDNVELNEKKLDRKPSYSCIGLTHVTQVASQEMKYLSNQHKNTDKNNPTNNNNHENSSHMLKIVENNEVSKCNINKILEDINNNINKDLSKIVRKSSNVFKEKNATNNTVYNSSKLDQGKTISKLQMKIEKFNAKLNFANLKDDVKKEVEMTHKASKSNYNVANLLKNLPPNHHPKSARSNDFNNNLSNNNNNTKSNDQNLNLLSSIVNDDDKKRNKMYISNYNTMMGIGLNDISTKITNQINSSNGNFNNNVNLANTVGLKIKKTVKVNTTKNNKLEFPLKTITSSKQEFEDFNNILSKQGMTGVNNDSKRYSQLKVNNTNSNCNNITNPSHENSNNIRTQDLNNVKENKETKFTETTYNLSCNNNTNQINQHTQIINNSSTLNKYFKSIATTKGQVHKKNSASMY